jgi:hypothetical protein
MFVWRSVGHSKQHTIGVEFSSHPSSSSSSSHCSCCSDISSSTTKHTSLQPPLPPKNQHCTQQVLSGDPVEINPSKGSGFRVMSVDEWAARFKRSEAFPACLACSSSNTKEHAFTQVGGCAWVCGCRTLCVTPLSCLLAAHLQQCAMPSSCQLSRRTVALAGGCCALRTPDSRPACCAYAVPCCAVPPLAGGLLLQTWCRGKRVWESECLCLDCHKFSWRAYRCGDRGLPSL